MTGAYRERVFSCPRDRTYKYYLPKEEAQPAWQRLSEEFGAPTAGACGVLVLETPRLLLRAPSWGNPVTVIRKRGWSEDDVRRFHELIRFPGDMQE